MPSPSYNHCFLRLLFPHHCSTIVPRFVSVLAFSMPTIGSPLYNHCCTIPPPIASPFILHSLNLMPSYSHCVLRPLCFTLYHLFFHSSLRYCPLGKPMCRKIIGLLGTQTARGHWWIGLEIKYSLRNPHLHPNSNVLFPADLQLFLVAYIVNFKLRDRFPVWRMDELWCWLLYRCQKWSARRLRLCWWVYWP